MSHARLDHLTELLAQLDERGASYTLRRTRTDGVVSVDVVVPGSRWEIDYLDDGTIDVEVFRSDGTIHDESALQHLLDSCRGQPS